MKKIAVLSLCLVLASSFAAARKATNQQVPTRHSIQVEFDKSLSDRDIYPVRAAAAQGTTYLAYYTFDGYPACTQQGWTSVDITAQPGDYFHVTDFTTPPEDCGPGTYGGLYPPEGAQALWCGACPDAGSDILCRYSGLPGYGNGWNQAFCSPCVATADTVITLDYMIVWDSETGYDRTYLEWDLCDGAYVPEGSVNGGSGYYDDVGSLTESIAINTGPGQFSFRFHFVSDGAWSDEDGIWNTDGAVIVDSLTVRSASGILVATETFEDESIGDIDATDWQSCTPPGYGDLAGLIVGRPTPYQNDPVQEDPCNLNFSCMWTFYLGSTANYACNTPNPSPQQTAVPYGNARGEYICTEVWSPWIPIAGTGTIFNLEFDIYRDLKLDALVFYGWHIRTKNAAGTNCPLGWQDRGSGVYYGASKDWFRSVHSVGDLVNSSATHVQIALWAVDMCKYWCGVMGSGACHSHAPLYDNVGLYRVAAPGPLYYVRDIFMFQDNFSADGTITGTARADMAADVASSSNPNIIPGDSVKIQVADPEVGLGGDTYTGCGPAVYCYLSVDPAQYTPLDKQAPETRFMGYGCGTALRFPHVFTTSAAGRTWDVYRMDSVFFSNGGLGADQYCIDFNDNLFVPGDTCWFFFGAKNSTGAWMYYSLPYGGHTPSLNVAASYPDEFTILPAVGDEPENDILYVDVFNFHGAQPYFDTASQNMNLLVDRYDVRGPSSLVGNRLGSRASFLQLTNAYRKILWNTGDLSVGCIGDGSNDKSDDASLLYNWLEFTPVYCGIYFSGDDIADEWAALTSPGAIALRTYCAYTVVAPDHVAYGVGLSPKVKGTFGGAFYHGGTGDSLIAYGGCPAINDFDVLAASPPTSRIDANYVEDPDYLPAGPAVGGAIVTQTRPNAAAAFGTVILSGFSYHEIRDIDVDGVVDRYHHLYDIITRLDNVIDPPIPVVTNPRRNSLAQNYPNPFNPCTTIKYTIKEPAFVSLKVYNVAGQLVKTLVNEVKKPDEVKPVEWNGLNNASQQVSSGVYFYKLVTKNFTQTKKMVLLK